TVGGPCSWACRAGRRCASGPGSPGAWQGQSQRSWGPNWRAKGGNLLFLPSPPRGEGRRLPAARQEDVRRLEVAMHDAAVVGVLHCPGQRLDQPGGFGGRRQGLSDAGGEVTALGKLQSEKRTTLIVADLANLQKVGMLQRRQGAGLAVEARQMLGVGEDAIAEHFDRDEAMVL